MSTLDELISAISGILSQNTKSYNLPSVCTQLGMTDGEDSEAFRSKAKYVERRLFGQPKEKVIEIAQRLLEDYYDTSLSNALSDFISAQYKVSLITRRNILDELLMLQLTSDQCISGRLGLVEFLNRIWSLNRMPSSDPRFTNAGDDISQHMVNNADWDFNYLFDNYLGLVKGVDAQFLKFVEQLVHPIVRQLEFQEQYVHLLNRHLEKDHYHLRETSKISGIPVYSAIHIQDGVPERVKNLIFAADGDKPEIVLDDSISNNIRITANEKSCLIYDRPIPASGLRWLDLVAWWHDSQEDKLTLEDSARNLGNRLLKSLVSPPERLLFETYFRSFKPEYGDDLPALIPQVYLHYDPYTLKQLQGNRRLIRQRMDFLLLFSEHQRIVIEVDGKQHYSDGDSPSPQKYSEMVAEDRRLRLIGYEIYRFGGYELSGDEGKNNVTQFFRLLLRKHGLIANKTK